MGYFPVRYDSRVVIYERKVFIRLATDSQLNDPLPVVKLLCAILFKTFFKSKCEARTKYPHNYLPT